jgi:hypothetical protein
MVLLGDLPDPKGPSFIDFERSETRTSGGVAGGREATLPLCRSENSGVSSMAGGVGGEIQLLSAISGTSTMKPLRLKGAAALGWQYLFKEPDLARWLARSYEVL